MNIGDLFRKKSIAQIKADAEAGFSDAEHPGGEVMLRRSLGTFDLTMLGIAAIIGAGIFAMVGNAANKGGPAVILLFIFAAIACGFAALCYAEFASKIPIAGSAYTYAYASFGELLAWVIGWDLLVEYAIGNIAVAISWSDYFTRLLTANGLGIPAYFTMDYLSALRGFTDSKEVVEGVLAQGQTLEALGKMTGDQLTAVSDKLSPGAVEAYTAWTTAPHIGNLPVILDLPALGIVVLITALVYIGIRESKTASNIMVALKLAVILLVIFVGAFFVKTANWNPFMPNGFTGVMSGVAAVFFAYIGFDALSTTAEECKDPYKTLPRGMIYSLLICTVLYVILALVLTGMVSYTKLAVGDPLAFVFGPEGVNIPWISGVIAVSAIIAIATVLLVFQLGQPRLWMAMSRDGLLPKIFSSIHPKFRTPWFSTILTGFMVAIPALFMNLSEVTDLSVIGTLFAFTIVCAGVLVKDKEFAGQKRFVPYINSQYIAPVLFVVVLFLVVYGAGVATLYDRYSKINEGKAEGAVSAQETTEAGKFDAYSLNNFSNSKVYSAGTGYLSHFFTDYTPDPEKKDETSFDVFKHKVPYFIFFIFSILMVVLCFVKRLSLIPVLGVMCCTYLMTELGWTNWYRFAIWMIIGIRIYRLFSFKNSKLNPEKQKPSGILNVASMLGDIIFFAFILIPVFDSLVGIETSVWLRLVLSLIIAIVLELLTKKLENRKAAAAA